MFFSKHMYLVGFVCLFKYFFSGFFFSSTFNFIYISFFSKKLVHVLILQKKTKKLENITVIFHFCKNILCQNIGRSPPWQIFGSYRQMFFATYFSRLSKNKFLFCTHFIFHTHFLWTIWISFVIKKLISINKIV